MTATKLILVCYVTIVLVVLLRLHKHLSAAACFSAVRGTLLFLQNSERLSTSRCRCAGMSPPTTKAPRSALSLKTGSLDAVLLLEGADEVLLHKCSSGLVAEQDDESLDSPESAQSG